MARLAQAVDGGEEGRGEPAQTIAEALMFSREKFSRAAAEALPEYDVQTIVKYVEKYDGPSSGGPTYMLVFLKRES